jgi:translocator protein
MKNALEHVGSALFTMRNTIGLAGWLALSITAGRIGSRFKPGDWYASLAKPSWNPPNAIFAPVWLTLYVLMAAAAWLVWRKAGFAGAGVALGLFAVQLVLNAIWSLLFFGRHRIGAALLDILALLVALEAVVLLFWRIDGLAGALMLPCFIWVAFAALLNYALWRLNSPDQLERNKPKNTFQDGEKIQ